MSKPREYWWSYAKAMIRAYPELKRKAEAQESLSNTKQRELAAVTQAIERTRQMRTGDIRLSVVDMVFWQKGYTVDGAAVKHHCSKQSAKLYHGDFIRLVGECYGLAD